MPQFLHDEATPNDRLNRADLASKVGDVIASCRAPAVFGVHGDWGAGKTSFLQILHFYMAGDCPQCASDAELRLLRARANDAAKPLWPDWKPKRNVAVVWFEAWRYQQEAAPVVALLQEVRAQLATPEKVKGQAKKWVTITAKLGFDYLGKQIGLPLSEARQEAAKWNKDQFADALTTQTLRELLQSAIDAVLPDPPKQNPKGPLLDDPRLVVLIDDLDRCDSQAAFKLLEGIKIYLNLPNCVFVLGVNQAVIEDSLTSQLKTGGDSRFQAREYLEKICKNFWYLPPQASYNQLLIDLLNDARSHAPDAHPIDVKFVGIVAKLVDESGCLPNNPRKVKAFVNTLARFLSRPSWNTEDPADTFQTRLRLCVLFAYVYQFHPDLYRLVEADTAAYSRTDSVLFYDELVEWCSQSVPKGKAGDKPHSAFEKVERVFLPKTDPSNPSTPKLVPYFVDPARGNVFRAQKLVYELSLTTFPRTFLAECLLK